MYRANAAVYTVLVSSADVSSRVIAEVRARILSGELPAGGELSQSQVARDLGTSRIPVRDAFFTLAAEGLLRLRPGSGAVVQPLTTEDLQEIYELRGAVEPLATRLGRPRVGRSELMQMSRILARMPAMPPAEWLQANTEFHAVLYRRCGRPRMIKLVEHLRVLSERYIHSHLTVIGHTEHLHEEHSAIFAAAEQGDGEQLEALVRQHLATSHDVILTYLLDRDIEAVPTATDRGEQYTDKETSR